MECRFAVSVGTVKPTRQIPRNRFVQVQQHADHRGPGGQLRPVQARRPWPLRRCSSVVARPPGSAAYCAAMLFEQAGQDGQLVPKSARATAPVDRPSAAGRRRRRPLRPASRRAKTRARLDVRRDRSAAPAPAAACSTAAARPCIPRASARRTPAGSGAGTCGPSRCTARGDTGFRRGRLSYSRTGKFRCAQ